MTVEMYKQPKRMVEDISALGLRSSPWKGSQGLRRSPDPVMPGRPEYVEQLPSGFGAIMHSTDSISILASKF